MKRAAVDHPKLQRLQRRLSLGRFQAMGLMEALWHFTGRYAPQGDIGRWSDEEIAAWVEWEGDPEELIGTLVTCGWIDRHPVFRLVVHDWSDHADEATKVSLKRAGKAFVVATVQAPKATPQEPVATVSGPPEPEPCHAMPPSESTNHPETEITSMAASLAESEPEPAVGRPRKRDGPTHSEIAVAWQEFDAIYPARDGDRRTAKGREKFAALIKSGVPPGKLLDGVRRYRAYTDHGAETGTRFVQQMTTWLNGGAWDEPWTIRTGVNGNGHQRQPQRQHGPGITAGNTVAATAERVLRELAERRAPG